MGLFLLNNPLKGGRLKSFNTCHLRASLMQLLLYILNIYTCTAWEQQKPTALFSTKWLSSCRVITWKEAVWHNTGGCPSSSGAGDVPGWCSKYFPNDMTKLSLEGLLRCVSLSCSGPWPHKRRYPGGPQAPSPHSTPPSCDLLPWAQPSQIFPGANAGKAPRGINRRHVQALCKLGAT